MAQRTNDVGVNKSVIRLLAVAGAIDAIHDNVIEADATAAGFTITLPLASICEGWSYLIKKIDATANVVTLNAAGVETIDGELTVVLAAQWDQIQITSDGVGWLIDSVYSTLTDPNNADFGTFPGAVDADSLVVQTTSTFKGQIDQQAAALNHDVAKVFADSPYAAIASDSIIRWDTTVGACTQTLPAIAGMRNRMLFINKSVQTNTLTIDPAGADTIDGEATKVLSSNESVLLYAPSAGTDWRILGTYSETPTYRNLIVSGAGDTLNVDDNVVVGATAAGTDAENVLALSNNATEPTTFVDLVQLYASDIAAGRATLALQTEENAAIDVVADSTHTLTIFVNLAGVKTAARLLLAIP